MKLTKELINKYYVVERTGRIYGIKSNKYMTPIFNYTGYYYNLQLNGKRCYITLHALLKLMFNKEVVVDSKYINTMFNKNKLKEVVVYTAGGRFFDRHQSLTEACIKYNICRKTLLKKINKNEIYDNRLLFFFPTNIQ